MDKLKLEIRSRLGKLKWILNDIRSQTGLRNRVPTHVGAKHLDLNPYQVYPQGGNLDVEFFTQAIGFSRFISTETPIASMGSCFAVEVQSHLIERRYNYIRTEESSAGSAEWGRVYTTKNMHQIFQYSFSEFQPNIRLPHTKRGVMDPYREGVFYENEDEAELGLAHHRNQSREALAGCEVLILTPGQNEAWLNKSDGTAWGAKPPGEIFDAYGKEQFEIHQFSLQENIEYLNNSLALLWENNSKARVIFTVSPVPSVATFFDVNVCVRSFENKAILLLAVKDVVKQYPDRCFYFPSFEMAMLSRNPAQTLDNRHIRPQMVNRIMKSFDECFTSS